MTIWDPDQGKLGTINTPRGGPPLAVTFSRDGARLASSHGRPGVEILDWTSRDLVVSLKGRIKFVRCMDFAPDGKALAAAEDDGIVRLWNPVSGDDLLTLRSEPGAVRAAPVLAGPTGPRRAVELPDGRAEILLWHAATGDAR